MSHLAPIALFVYNRPWHTQQTIQALLNNDLAGQSNLIIFSDGAKNGDVAIKVREVRDYLKTISGFKTIQIIERDDNWGLAKSIITGVTEIVNKYGKIIVLEDDIVTSPTFLSFMNGALEYYQNEEKVWHISGWNYPINPEGLGDVFFWRGMECWGWATWSDRWESYKKDTDFYMSNLTKEQIDYLNLDKTRKIWQQVIDNHTGKINTWAVYWYIALVLNEKLSINPSISYVRNIGLDGTGENCGNEDFQRRELNSKSSLFLPCPQVEDFLAVEKIKNFILSEKKSIFSRIKNRIRRELLK